jgi:hypothetical protein
MNIVRCFSFFDYKSCLLVRQISKPFTNRAEGKKDILSSFICVHLLYIHSNTLGNIKEKFDIQI